MMTNDFMPPADEGVAGQFKLLEATLPWLSDFCGQHGFVDKSGRTKFARALNLISGHHPKTKAERSLLVALVNELENRFPGESYPAAAVRRPPRQMLQ